MLMYIEKLEIRGFGKLSGLELELRKGLNLIYGQNESGKTTLQAFIKAMLYGLKGGRAARDGVPAPAARYRPWEGGSFGGTVEYRLDNGLLFRVERDFGRNSAEVYDDHFGKITGDFLTGRDGSLSLAQRHTGLNEACFEKTVFVKQMEVSLSGEDSAVLSGRLANASETGFEDISFKRAEKALGDALISRVGTDRSSARPLDRINARLGELDALKASQLSGKTAADSARSELQMIGRTREELLAGREFLGKVKKLIDQRKLLEARMASESSLRDAAKRLQEIEARLESKTAGVKEGAYAGKIFKKMYGKMYSLIKPACAALFALSILAVLLGRQFSPYYYTVSILLLAAAAVIIAISAYGDRMRESDGTADINERDGLALLLQLKDRQKELYSKASLDYGFRLGNLQELREAISEASSLIADGEATLEQTLRAACSAYAGRAWGPFDPKNLEAIIYDASPEWLESALAGETERVAEALGECALKERELETLIKNGEEEAALQKIEEEEALLWEKKTELEKTGEALKLALEVLNGAAADIRKSLSPALEKRMGAIAAEITGGRYMDLRVDDRLELKTVSPESGGISGIRVLSGGTSDQLYLAMRLAMAEILAPEGESLPVFLDEVFSQFDDARTARTVRYLFEEYGDRQVLLFTCKERELETVREICGNGFNLLTLDKGRS